MREHRLTTLGRSQNRKKELPRARVKPTKEVKEISRRFSGHFGRRGI